MDGPGIESRCEARFSAPVQTGPGAYPASCTMDTGSFPGVKNGRDVTLTPQPLLVPWSWKSRAIRLLLLWAVRPVQSLSACTRVHITLSLPFYADSFLKSISYLVCANWKWPSLPKLFVKCTKSLVTIKSFCCHTLLPGTLKAEGPYRKSGTAPLHR